MSDMDAAVSGALFGGSTALLSDCGLYRYRLGRRWGEGPAAVFVMLNPSTADAEQDDPTIRRCIGFARSWGYNALEVVNLYAYRATQPRDLWLIADPVGPDNNSHIFAVAISAGVLVAAWGNNAQPERAGAVVRLLLRALMPPLVALGVTKTGAPRHPLYVRADAQPVPYQDVRP